MFSNLRATHQQARKKLTCLVRTEQLFTNDRGEWERNVLFSRSKLFLLNINYSCRRATGIVRNRKGSRENAFIRRNVLSEGGKEKKWAEQWEVVKEREQRKSLLRAVQYVYIYIYKCVRCTMFRNSHTRSLSPPKPKSFLYRNLLCLMTQAAHAPSNASHTLIRFPLIRVR